MTEHQLEPEPGPAPATEPSDPWPHSPYPPLELAPAFGRRRWRRWWVAAAAVTAVLAVAAFATALTWPHPPAPEPAAGFQPLEQRWQIDAAEPSGNTFSQVVGGRAYLGWQQGDDLALTAVDLATGEPAWQARIAGAAGQYWGGMLVSAEAVVAYGYPVNLDDSGELAPGDPVPMVVLDADTGGSRYRWDREVHRDDQAWLAGGVLVLVDRYREALLGLHLDTGDVAWSVPFPTYRGEVEPDEGTPAAVVPVLTEEDLDAPSTWWGAPVGIVPDRLVLIGVDRTARVIDSADGQVIGTVGTNVADPEGDVFLAYQDRLFVTSGQPGYQIYARELAALAGQPELVYTTPDPDRSLAAPLTPCGQWRVCVLDRAGQDGAANQVRALDVAPGRTGDPQRWSHEVPFAGWLVAAGDLLLVGGGDDAALIGYDRGGEQVLDQPYGAAARIDAGRLLLFASVPGDHAQDLSLAGLPAGGERVELGQLPGVHGERCSWSDAYLVCPAEEGAAAWQFAGPETGSAS